MIKFLEETKAFLNGRDFSDDLNRKEKRKIFDAFMALNAKYEYDADEDWADVFVELGKLRVDFNANADYANGETIRKYIDGMEINVNGDDATIEAAINYLKKNKRH